MEEFFASELIPAGIDKRVEHTNFKDTPEVSCRSTGRWEVKVPLVDPWTAQETIRNPLVTDVLVRSMDSERLEMDTYSVVTSLSDTPIQHWHRDAAPLFEAPQSGPASHPRPHGIVVFVPLDDVPLERGPTEFLLRSHIQCARDREYEGKLDGGPDPALPKGSPRRNLIITECPHSFDAGTWKAIAETGDVILFDLRILHRGGENVSPGPRPQIYATYTREWYVDAVNFHTKQTRAFDELDKANRKLLTRIDHQAYVESLESMVQKELGVDPKSLQSDPKWRKVDL